MQLFTDFIIREETYEEQIANQHHNPAQVMVITLPGYEHCKFYIGAGTSDELYVFCDGDLIYVMSRNLGLEYLAMEMYTLYGTEWECSSPEFDVFFEDHNIPEELEDYADADAATLRQYAVFIANNYLIA
jgi:hypothetical protein